MNMNRNLVNRALLDVGIQPLVDADLVAENTNFLIAKHFYLETFLEALSEVPWTGGRKREKLLKTGRPHLGSGYRFMYDVPFDCARPIELGNNEYFIIEDRFLCTNADHAELLYITNGKLLRTIAAVTMRPGDIPDMEYLTAGHPDDEPELVLRAGRPGDIPPYDGPADQVRELPEDPVIAEDYPDYRPPEYESKFYEYVEKTLAAKFAMKLSAQPELHMQLLQEAMLIREGAITASMSASAAKRQPQKWWKEELGL
jgi:hypothetical protein